MIKIDNDELKAIFEKHDNQYDSLIDIYKIAFPRWSEISEIDGSPYVSPQTWEDICGYFIAFDKEHHPTVFNGGCWLSRGFSSRPGMRDGMIDISHLKIGYKEAVCS